MVILAIDIALRRSGWALIRSLSDYQTGDWETSGDHLARWRQIRAECWLLCNRHRPSLVAIEDAGAWGKASGHTTDRSIRALASARSVAACACSDFAPVRMISVDEWHEAFAGHRGVNKTVVQSILRAEGYPIPTRGKSKIEDGDQCDALALGLYVWRQESLRARLRGA